MVSFIDRLVPCATSPRMTHYSSDKCEPQLLGGRHLTEDLWFSIHNLKFHSAGNHVRKNYLSINIFQLVWERSQQVLCLKSNLSGNRYINNTFCNSLQTVIELYNNNHKYYKTLAEIKYSDRPLSIYDETNKLKCICRDICRLFHINTLTRCSW